MKGILEFLAKDNRWAIVLVLLLMVFGGIVFNAQRNKIKEWKQKHLTEVKLNKALNDSVSYYQNAWGEEVAEKLTIQATVKQLENRNDELTASQKELLARVKEAEEDNSIITAALIEARVLIDSLKGTGPVSVTDTTVTFSSADTAKHFQYEIKIGEVRPLNKLVEPTILFKRLEFPNINSWSSIGKTIRKKVIPLSSVLAIPIHIIRHTTLIVTQFLNYRKR